MSPAASLQQASQSGVATRGRPRQFSDADVLDALVQLFWEQGYEATSMTDIVTATGLSKSSLYNTFGSKDELFSQALNRYIDLRSSMMTEVLAKGTRGLEDLNGLLDALWAEVSVGDDHRGCLAINTATELGRRDDAVAAVATRFRATLRDALKSALQRAADLGEIDPQSVDPYAAVMLSFMLGTAVIVRSGAADDEILDQLDAARAIIDSWRTT